MPQKRAYRRPRSRTRPPSPTAFIVIGDEAERGRLVGLVERAGRRVEGFATAEDFMERSARGVRGCLLIDGQAAGSEGLDLLVRMSNIGIHLPAVVIAEKISQAVAAIRAGAAEVVEKPVGEADLLRAIRLAMTAGRSRRASPRRGAASFADLTARQLQVLQQVLAGQPNKNIAADLGISRRTVETHRALIMRRTGAHSLPELARLAMMANWYDDFTQ